MEKKKSEKDDLIPEEVEDRVKTWMGSAAWTIPVEEAMKVSPTFPEPGF